MTTGWHRGIYPIRTTAETAVSLGDMFPDDKILVLHTLVVEPSAKGKGYARAFLEFYENYALERGCHVLRIDTNQRNSAARAMYAKHGWREAGIVPCTFNGLPGVQMVCLEKKI